MSLKTGEHATLTSKQEVQQLLEAKFTGVPEDWLPAIADQVIKEDPSPAGEKHCLRFATSGAGRDTILLFLCRCWLHRHVQLLHACKQLHQQRCHFASGCWLATLQ